MNAIQTQQVQRIVEAALKMPREQRSAYLDRECSADASMRPEIEARLAQAEQAAPSDVTRSMIRPAEAATIDAIPPQAPTVDAPLTGTHQAGPIDIPGYRILKTLGKGGMGVVCLAQDLKLPRLVALKMIKAGSDADDKQKARFQAEAAAVAQLVHPHIVQIHDLGVHAGQPYFVLEYVDGGTLAQQLQSARPTPQRSAEITMALAKAVQFAHQHGIIHRDLKPANVLLTRDGNPKITDFGLAKQLDTDQGLSIAGDIMGTPSYMAPEQAFGRVQDIVPATDVYALGAILYEMLTGRPPFQGNTALDTLDLVRQQEPTPPRRLQPNVPRDLETICLKCLRKERSQRYSSALALAQDLERFLAGEAILARPEGVLARISRKVRRNRAVSVLCVALLIAVAATALVVVRSGGASRIQELENRLEADRSSEWSDAKLADHEELLDQLALLAPDRAGAARGRLHQSLLDSGTKRLQQPTTLQPEDEAYAKRVIALLVPRDKDMSDALQRTYQSRLRSWEEVFALTAIKRNDAKLHPAKKGSPRIVTKEACKGNVRLEATWDSWDSATQVGLWLHAEPAKEKAGYQFLLETLPVMAESKKGLRTPTFAEVRQTGGMVQIQILRNGLTLRKAEVDIAKLPAGPLKLEAQREADRLLVRFNPEVFLETRDLIPLTPHGYYGVVWPELTPLASLRGLRQALPIMPGPLETGDELYAQGQFDGAHAYYARQAIALSGTPAGMEARYKESLTLEHLRRTNEAVRGYEAVAAEINAGKASKWAVLASFQLWVHQLRSKKMDQADAILESLLFYQSREKDENLLLYIPDDVRAEILTRYHDAAVGLGLWRYDPRRVHNTRRLVQLEEMLDVPFTTREYTLLALMRALRLEGQLDEAIRAAESRLMKVNAPGPDVLNIVLEYAWLMREKGTPSRALVEINRFLNNNANIYRGGVMSLLIERSRLRAANKEWDLAQKDLDDFFRLGVKDPPTYRQWSDACLVLGFLCKERGDHAGALEAWRKGKYDDPKDPQMRGVTSNGVVFTNTLLLDSLCQDLTEARTETLFRAALRDQAAISTMFSLIDTKTLFKSATGITNRMWQDPKSQDFARQMALQTCSFRDFMHYPVRAFTVEMARTEALAGKSTPEQDELLWRFAEEGTLAFGSGKLSDSQAMQLALLWKRGPSFLGGIEILKNFDPALRGPAAYLMGLRFQRLGRPADDAFRMALEIAPANSPLERLARIEVDKLGKKKTP